jgi:hypothetical protein
VIFGKKTIPDTRIFCLTIDVEPDAGPGWKTTSPITFEGVHNGILSLHQRCEPYGVIPTHLLNPVIMKDLECVRFFKSLPTDSCELGAHLHGDYMEPEARYPGPDYSGCNPGEMQCDYPEELEYKKLEALTGLFVQQFGYRPLSFRAGRFGARSWTLKCLKRLGYTHDSSVTPFRNWYNKADYSKAHHLIPYRADPDHILESATSGLVEVPVSITPRQYWLRPTPGFSNLTQMKKVVRWFEKTQKASLLCCMLHNVELVPGKSPYCATEKESSVLLDHLESLFRWLKRREYQFYPLCRMPVPKP